MKRIIYCLAAGALLFGLAGCYHEEALTPTEENENVYSEYDLPQGNHDYDSKIQDMFRKYNTLFLYKYNPKDIYYGTTEYLAGSYLPEKDSTIAGLFDVPSDELWVGEQLNLIQELWLDYYPADFLKRLPHKVFLLDSLYVAMSGKGTPLACLRENLLTRKGVDYILVTYGSSRIKEMTKKEKYEFKKALHRIFLDNVVLPVTAPFAAVGNYAIFSNSNNKQYMYVYGFIDWDKSRTPQEDWKVYMDAVIDHPYREWISDGTYGFLHPSRDTQGRIRQKYNLIIEHFKTEYQIDLEKISNDLADYDE